MATKAKSKGKEAFFKGFVTYAVDKALKLSVDADGRALEDVILRVVTYGQKGCKVSVTWEEGKDCWFISMYRNDTSYADAGWILTARHADLAKACKIILIVDEQVYGGVWANEDGEVNQYDW